MKICENGVMRDMTPEEIAELEALAAEAPAPEPTAEDRLGKLDICSAKTACRNVFYALLVILPRDFPHFAAARLERGPSEQHRHGAPPHPRACRY